MLCDHLERWDREGGREGDARGKRYGDICIYITDSLCYKAETNTPLKSNYTPKKTLKKKKKRPVKGFPGGTVVKNLPANAGYTGLSPGPGRSHMLWSN